MYREPKVEHFYPHTVEDLAEFIEWAEIVNPELKLLWDSLALKDRNVFIDTADAKALSKLEEQYGILNTLSNIDDRRYALKAKQLERVKYTEKNLIELLDKLTESKKIKELSRDTIEVTQKEYNDLVAANSVKAHVKYKIVEHHMSEPLTLDEYIELSVTGALVEDLAYPIVREKKAIYIDKKDYIEGEDIYTFVHADNYILTILPNKQKVKVRLFLKNKDRGNIVTNTLKEVIPMHLELEADLLYNAYGLFKSKTHGELKVYTHNQLREEVI